MLIHIDTTKLEKYSLDLGSVLLALAETYKVDLQKTADMLVSYGEADTVLDETNFGIKLRPILYDKVHAFIADCTPTETSDDALRECAEKLKKIYPKGKKPGTNKYWADSVPLIVERLKLFFARYGEYPLSDIEDAVRRYVDENKDSPYMRTLRYFIMKNDARSGNVERSADLLNYLELKEEQTESHDDGFVTLV